MTLLIRSATPGDWDFIAGLYAMPHVRVQVQGPSRERFLHTLRPGYANFIAERDGAPQGNLVLETDPAWLANVRALATSEPRRGTGRALIEFAVKHSFETLRADRIFLEVLAANAAARTLYERAGFRPEGLYRDGCRSDDGTYRDLVPYGMLSRDRGALQPPFTRLDHVQIAIPTGGEERARAFYAGVLGFEELAKPPELAKRGGAWFRSGDVHVHLGADPDFRPAAKAHPAVVCADYEALCARLQAAGAAVKHDDRAHRGRAHCYVDDPFGNRIELIAGP